MILPKQKKAFLDFISSYDAFVIAGHKEPDGDCLASCIGLSALLSGMGKKTLLVSAGPFKRPETRVYEQFFKKSPQNGLLFADDFTPGCKTALIIADCSAVNRLGDLELFVSGLPSFVIDHHRTASFDESFSIIVPAAPATSYLVQLLYEQIAGSLPHDVAATLFFGLATDTGFFRFLDTESADVFRAAARLIEKGANPRIVYADMTGGKSFSSRKLLGILLERTEQHFGGRLALTWETPEDTRLYGQDGRDSDALYQLLLAVENVAAIAVIRQETEEKCTIGLRSKEEIDVSCIAAKYGGGGHKNAAGLTVETTIERFIPVLLQEFSQIL